jgi:AhpD family alkylhydroperoxidase
MQPRLDVRRVPPGAMKVMLGFGAYLSGSGLAPELLDLIYLRASQINGCAYCIDMHTKDLRARGETEQRLYLLDAWREAPFYSDRERAALAWTEAVTRVTDGHVPDEVYEQVHSEFSDTELANLTLAIVAINSWNRLNIAFRTVAGGYQPATKENLAASARK